MCVNKEGNDISFWIVSDVVLDFMVLQNWLLVGKLCAFWFGFCRIARPFLNSCMVVCLLVLSPYILFLLDILNIDWYSFLIMLLCLMFVIHCLVSIQVEERTFSRFGSIAVELLRYSCCSSAGLFVTLAWNCSSLVLLVGVCQGNYFNP